MVHFRKVHHFIYPKDLSDEVIIAEDFFETKQKWASSRVKESELIKSAAMLAESEILGLSLGKTEIKEKNKEYFIEVIDDFKEVVRQFIEMTLPSDSIDHAITESDSLEPAYEVGEEDKEVIKQYGVNKVIYKTVRRTDEILEETNFEFAKWYVVDAQNKFSSQAAVLTLVRQSIESKVLASEDQDVWEMLKERLGNPTKAGGN